MTQEYTYKLGDEVGWKFNDTVHRVRICGIAAIPQAVIGPTYIVEPIPPLHGYPWTHIPVCECSITGRLLKYPPCIRCDVEMQPGQAFNYTKVACLGYPYDAKLTNCLKCPECGHSETIPPKEA